MPSSRGGASHATSHSGFTLVELVVALMVGGMAILGARTVLATVAEHADRVADAARTADQVANGERVLRALVGDLEIGTTGETTFGGDEHEAKFTTWCAMPSGWEERCTVRLVVRPSDSRSGTSVVAAHLSTGECLVLLESDAMPRLRYLRDAANGGTWFHRWGTGIAAPLAIGIVTDRDTLLVRIGERG